MAADQLQDRLGPTGIGQLCPTCTQWLRRVLGQQGSSTNDAPGSCCANRPAGTDDVGSPAEAAQSDPSNTCPTASKARMQHYDPCRRQGAGEYPAQHVR